MKLAPSKDLILHKLARRLPSATVSTLLFVQLLCYAQVAAPTAPQPPLPPGQLIDLGGYRLHLWCTGKGSPTVVLSPGSGDFSFDWALVQPGVARRTRVCSYDRAGEAWSDLGPTPRTRSQEVFDLRRALLKAHVKGPYVLVGHSAGGPVVRLFAAEYPADVAGMVLVDGSHEEDTGNINGKMVTGFSLSKGRPVPPPRTSVTAADGLDDDAIRKIQAMVARYDFMQPKIEPPYDRLPADVQRLQLWAVGQPKHWAATSNEYGGEEDERLYKIDHQTVHPLGSIPLVVLSQDMSKRTDEHARIHIRTQQAQSQYSERGRQIVVAGAGHHIQLERPEVVVAAVKQVLDDARHSTNRRGNRK
jgi:pimeloyl-ACP methyl ester carboxylesterase